MPLMIHCPTLCPDRHRSDLSQGLRTVVRKRIRRIDNRKPFVHSITARDLP